MFPAFSLETISTNNHPNRLCMLIENILFMNFETIAG